MKSNFAFLVLCLIPLAFYPIPGEQFESIKTWILVSVGVLGFALEALKGHKESKLIWPLLAFLASAALSTIFALDRNYAIYGNPRDPIGLQSIAAYVGLFFFFTHSILTPRDYNKTLWSFPVVVLLSGTYALLQLSGNDVLTWSGEAWAISPSDEGIMRPAATFGHSNFLAAYFVMAFPILLHLREVQTQRWRAWLLSLAIMVCVVVVVVAQSRAAWFAMAVLLILQFRAYHWRTRLLGGMAALGIIVLLCVFIPQLYPSLLERMKVLVNPGVARLEYLSNGLKMWRAHPLLGVGPDNYELLFNRMRSARYWAVEPDISASRAHSLPVDLLATQGLLGFFCAAWLVWALFKLCRKSPSPPYQAQAIVAFGITALSGFVVVPTGMVLLYVFRTLDTIKSKELKAGFVVRMTTLIASLAVVYVFVIRHIVAIWIVSRALALIPTDYDGAFKLLEESQHFYPPMTLGYKTEYELVAQLAASDPKNGPKYRDQAIRACRGILAVHPDYASAHYILSQIAYDPGERGRELGIARELEPFNPRFK